MGIRTIHATVTTTDGNATQLHLSEASVDLHMVIYITAFEAATNDYQFFAFHATRENTAPAVDNTAIHAQSGVAGGSGWTVEFDNNSNALRCRVTGEISHTIVWTALVHEITS